jgi:mono/diheme cytochrome c family protein
MWFQSNLISSSYSRGLHVRESVSICTAALVTAVAAFAAASLTVPATAQQPEAGGDQAMIDRGKVTFAQKCSHCHGPNMVNAGTVTPDLRRFPDDQTRFVTTVKQGKNNRMPPWGDLLSDDEIRDLWAYVSSRRAS